MFNCVAQKPCQETNTPSQRDSRAWLMAKMGLDRELGMYVPVSLKKSWLFGCWQLLVACLKAAGYLLEVD